MPTSHANEISADDEKRKKWNGLRYVAMRISRGAIDVIALIVLLPQEMIKGF